MNRIFSALLVLGMVGFTAPVFADDASGVSSSSCAICSKTTSGNWGVRTTSKLGRGVANAGGCWTEMIRQPRNEHRAGGNWAVGMGKGLGHTCLRLVKGGAEILTSPLPNAKDGSQIATDCPMCMWEA